MNASKKASLFFLCLIALACMSGYFAQSTPEAKLDETQLALIPDHKITTLVMQQFDERGVLIQALKTPYLIHLPGENKHWLKTPQILIMKDHQSPLTIEAEEMTYFPQNKLAQTETHVVVTQAGNTMQSEGVKAYLAENRVELLHQARVTYDPKQG